MGKVYNERQLEAIESTEAKVFIAAPAGSGKTHCLVGAVERYAKENPFSHITVITFTRKAAAELKERIDALTNIDISTIHAWAWRRLAAIGAEFGFVVQLLEDDQIKVILKRLCQQRNQYYINQFMLFSYVMGNYNIDIDDSLKRTYEAIRLDYVKFKRKQSLYDFTDLPLYLYDKMKEYDVSINDVDGLFVDEFQDVDEIQFALFEEVHAKKKFYIGDPRQNIYQFRSSIDNVVERLTDFSFYELDINYRSKQEIFDYAETVRKEALELIDDGATLCGASVVVEIEPSAVKCERGLGGEVYSFGGWGSCINCVDGSPVNEVLTMKKLLTDPKTQILCRSNKQVKKIQTYGFTNVSTVHQAKGLEYDNVVVVDFPIGNTEELNICYVAITRAKNKVATTPFDVMLNLICHENIQPISNRLF